MQTSFSGARNQRQEGDKFVSMKHFITLLNIKSVAITLLFGVFSASFCLAQMKRITASLIYFLGLIFIGYANPSSYAQTASDSTPRYDLTIRLSPDAHRLEATGTIRLPASNMPRTALRLSLSELMQDFTVEVVEPAASAGTARLERRDASGGNIKWIVLPVRPIPAGEAVRLRFSYAGGEQIANQFYIGPEGSFASVWGGTDWYPLLDGEDDKGIGTLRFSVPTGYTVYATGERRSSSEGAAQGRFQFEVNHRTYFSFAAGRYTVVRRAGVIPVSAYLLRTRQNTDQYLDGISRILNLLSQEFGRYRFSEFALIEVPSEQANRARFNGAAYEGFFFTSSLALDVPEFNLALPYFAHELGHEWFPHIVALKRGRGRFTEEALAQYGSLRVVEAMQGATVAEQYRRTGLPNYSVEFSALGYFKMAAAGSDQRLADLQGEPGRRLAYTKGFLVWDMLSREIGRERFQRILHNLTRRYAFREITWDELLRAIEVGAGRNLRWFYEQWFERTGAPDFQLTWRREGRRLRGVITQASPFYRATLEIEAKSNQGQRLVRVVRVSGAQTPFSFPVNFQVEAVTLDPHYLVLRWTPEYRNAASAARPSSQKVSQ